MIVEMTNAQHGNTTAATTSQTFKFKSAKLMNKSICEWSVDVLTKIAIVLRLLRSVLPLCLSATISLVRTIIYRGMQRGQQRQSHTGHSGSLLVLLTVFSIALTLQGCDNKKDNVVNVQLVTALTSFHSLDLSGGATHYSLSQRAVKAPAIAGYAFSSSTPVVPFVANQMVIAAPLSLDGSSIATAGLWRQSDCSLTEAIFQIANDFPAPNSEILLPNAQDYLHSLSGLSSAADVFPKGCTDSPLGQTAVTVGAPIKVTADLASLAELTGNGLVVKNINITTNAISTITLSSSPNILAFVVADINGDGSNDIVASGVTDPATNMPAFAIYLNNGDGTFKAPTYADAPASLAFTVDDVNGDGKPDIIFNNIQYSGNTSPNVDTVTTLLGNGDGTFKAGVGTTIPYGSGLDSLITGDFNSDGKKDVLFGNAVLLGNGDGTFTVGPALPLGVQGFAGFAFSAAVGDFNKDGKMDVVFASGPGGSGSVQIMLGNGDGSFEVGPRYASISNGGQSVAVTDIDGDGNPDIVVGNSSPGFYAQDSDDNLVPMLQILLGGGDGTFVGAPTYFNENSIYQSVSQFTLGDFNGDRKADVLAIEQFSSPSGTIRSLGMLRGDGTGKFGTAITSSLNLFPQFIVAADMNKDGKLDAVLAGPNTNGLGAGVVSVLLNQGTGNFAGEQDYPLPSGPTSLAVGDFNGDGFVDVAVGVSGGVYVLLGQANGTLAAPVKIDASANPVSIAAADINSDGRADLVIADQGTNFPGSTNGVNGALHVFLGNANGTFTAVAAPTTTAGVYSQVAIGDLNKDGKLDLIVGGGASGNVDAPNVYTLLGNGDGTFQAAQVTALIGTDDFAPNSMTLADFNGDGNLDVIVGGQNDFTEVFLGNGDGTFAQGLMALAQQPTVLGAVDLNGDGLPELLVGSGGGLTVFLNQAKWPSISGAPVSVPNVVALTQAAATTAITSAGLIVGTVTQASSGTVPVGNVISQSPASGASVAAGSAVNLVVSSGTAPVSVPNVVGLTQAAATTAIKGAGLAVGTVSQASSSTVPAGSVISQSPVGGSSVASGSAVNLVVSSGTAPVSVPNVVGLTQAAATSAIMGAGLKVGMVTQASSNTVPAGSVISQSPVGGSSVASGSAVNLVVSSGMAPVSVPNVVGLMQAAATSAITGAGLKLGTVTQASSSTVPAGSVISQSPVGGTGVASGSAVNLVVSSGAAPVSVPSVVGLTQAAATSVLTGAGLKVGTVTQTSSSTVPAGSVVSQSPVGGTSVAIGTAVNLVVSSGAANTTVPNVENLAETVAMQDIVSAGLIVGTVKQANSNNVPAGRVISQNPPPGAAVAKGSAVSLVVSTGPSVDEMFDDLRYATNHAVIHPERLKLELIGLTDEAQVYANTSHPNHAITVLKAYAKLVSSAGSSEIAPKIKKLLLGYVDKLENALSREHS